LVVGITGVTGAAIGVAVLRALADIDAVCTHLVISRWGKTPLAMETDESIESAGSPAALQLCSAKCMGGTEGKYPVEENTDDRWLTRQELADRYGLPVKTPADWASKGTEPRYAMFG
jgi:hypothetical protein